MQHRLNEIPGINVKAEALTKRPTFPLATLPTEEALHQFLSILDWMLEDYAKAWPDFKQAD